QAEDGIRDFHVTGVQTCALPISRLCIRPALLVTGDVHGLRGDGGALLDLAHDLQLHAPPRALLRLVLLPHRGGLFHARALHGANLACLDVVALQALVLGFQLVQGLGGARALGFIVHARLATGRRTGGNHHARGLGRVLGGNARAQGQVPGEQDQQLMGLHLRNSSDRDCRFQLTTPAPPWIGSEETGWPAAENKTPAPPAVSTLMTLPTPPCFSSGRTSPAWYADPPQPRASALGSPPQRVAARALLPRV